MAIRVTNITTHRSPLMISTRARTHSVSSRRKHEHGHELGVSEIDRRNISGFDWAMRSSLIASVGSEDAASVTDGLGLQYEELLPS
jgi:hypothetical protein